MAEAVCTQQGTDGALIKTYEKLYYELPEDQRPGKYADMIAELRAEADAYNALVCGDFVMQYRFGTLKEETGKTVAIAFNRDAIIASILSTIGEDALTAEQLASVDKAIAANVKLTGDVTVTVSAVDMEYTSTTTDSLATESSKTYLYTPYTLNDSRCVMLTYTKGTADKDFVLNYNLFDVEVRYTNESDFTVTTFAEDGEKTTVSYKANDVVLITIPSYQFVRIDVKGGN